MGFLSGCAGLGKVLLAGDSAGSGAVTMRRLVFIDDDESELEAFRKIVSGVYDCATVHWPVESGKLLMGRKPAIFVSDLYLPSLSGDRTPASHERDAARKAANKTGERFCSLYAGGHQDDKARLRRTMKAIADGYAILKLQWSALGQSPDYGVEVLKKVKARYPEVPFVFYSRKITPEDVIRVLKAGAVDAIRKCALTDDEVLARLKTAQRICRRGSPQTIRKQGLNVNFTSLPTS
jgi:DNA-binding NarL/FixJ family response regulator